MAESLIAAVSPSGTVKAKPRRVWIAGLLALFQPGLGHLYGGRPVLALLIELGPLVFTLSFGVFSAFFPRWAFPAVIALLASYALLWVWQLVSACLLARHQGTTYRLAWYNHVIIYVLFVIALRPIFAPALTLVRQRYIEPFKIPSASMAPTLLPGDQLFVIKSSPASNWTRGDVVVFRGPGETGIEPFHSVAKGVLHVLMGLGTPEQRGKAWVMRIIALGGDTVEIRDRQIFVNGQAYAQAPWEQSTPFGSSECLLETLPSGKSYSVLYSTALKKRRQDFPPVRVEANHLYLLGDNRDDSYDSRYFGQVSEDRVAGRAAVIWLSYSEADFIRWGRMGQQL